MAPKSKSNENDGGKGSSGGRKKVHEVGTEEYLKRRERNNLAVKKSRDKSRMKAKETIDRVSKLREENTMLEQKVALLSKELSLLKDLFLAHAGTASEGNCQTPTANAAQPTVNTVAVISDHEYATSPSSESVDPNEEDSNSN